MTTHDSTSHPEEPGRDRSERYKPRRSRSPGILAAAVLGGAVAALAVSSFYDDRPVHVKVDATVDAAQDVAKVAAEQIKLGGEQVAQQGAAVGERVATSIDDAGITTSVKAALAADPTLSALKIDVVTRQGVVMLTGPAPDEKSRERASVLAAAPDGVRSVDNRLVVAPPARS